MTSATHGTWHARQMPPAPQRSAVGSVVALAALYEVAADTINEALGDDLLPTALRTIDRFSYRKLLRPPPKWVAPASFALLGLAISTARRKRSG